MKYLKTYEFFNFKNYKILTDLFKDIDESKIEIFTGISGTALPDKIEYEKNGNKYAITHTIIAREDVEYKFYINDILTKVNDTRLVDLFYELFLKYKSFREETEKYNL